MVHILGFNGLTEKLMNALDEKGIMLIEDCCELTEFDNTAPYMTIKLLCRLPRNKKKPWGSHK